MLQPTRLARNRNYDDDDNKIRENVGSGQKYARQRHRRRVHPLVQKLFLDHLRKKGVALTGHQLIDEARRRRLKPPTLQEAFRFIREDVPELVGFAGGRVRPKQTHFQTIGVSKPGVFL